MIAGIIESERQFATKADLIAVQFELETDIAATQSKIATVQAELEQ